MATGTVKWFNRAKGFGFIRPDIGARDAFVHVSAVHVAGLDVIEEGQRIEFELTQMRDGRLTALGLRLLEDEEIENPNTDEPPGTIP
ncbi:cold-shock protein [Polymorphobacter arshaanensis]|uniref:Cold-shock protein n=1 Tax=Glacieibacterium arshaanense TaxID=2511025 RepID=A0A4Y9ESM9_9SPHN|nr:cold-shock protein [Polymorphobacter arshaanensis]TFU05908.1 cold-shock protein [Polymorphobacter arshaanensis]